MAGHKMVQGAAWHRAQQRATWQGTGEASKGISTEAPFKVRLKLPDAALVMFTMKVSVSCMLVPTAGGEGTMVKMQSS